MTSPCVPTAPPLEGGSKPQVVLRYCGPATAGIGQRGRVTKIEYRFANSPGRECFWVYAEDVDHFRLWPDKFEVLEETRIDPVADALRARQDEVSQLRFEVERLSRSRPADAKAGESRLAADTRPRVPRGRKNKAEMFMPLAWHLRHHCPDRWSMKQLAEKFLDAHLTNPANAVSLHFGRWKVAHPSELDPISCRYCSDHDCPPPP